MGYAMGPVYITIIIAVAGLERSYWAALPGVLMTVYLLLSAENRHFVCANPFARKPSGKTTASDTPILSGGRPFHHSDRIRGFSAFVPGDTRIW